MRLPEGENWENISQDLLTDCAQLTKANSIEGMLILLFLGRVYEGLSSKNYASNRTAVNLNSSLRVTGNKKDNITVIYTPWSNLKKDGSMVTGQVGFKDQRKVGADIEYYSFIF